MTLRIMPMGDSITDGITAGGYRYYLYFLLTAAHVDFDFVGSQNSATGLWPDEDHEGHSGWRLDMMDGAAAGWLAANPADVVLLMGGTNDIALTSQTGATCASRLQTLLATIYGVDPSILVIVASIPHMDVALGWEAERLVYKSLMPDVFAARRAAGQQIISIDGTAGVETADEYGHLTPAGYEEFAARWYAAINPSATATLTREATYELTNVWSTGTDADTSAYDLTPYLRPPGLVIDGIGRATNRAFAPPATPALDFHLPNYDGLYSPGGTLGPFVGRGPASTVVANWGVTVMTDAADVLTDTPDQLTDGRIFESLFTGTIATAPQQIDRAAAVVQIRSLGTIARLQRTRPTTTLYENIRTDQAITVLLDAAGWDPLLRSIDTGDTTLLYWWLNGQTDCLTALRAILEAEGVPSCAYEDGEGVFHFEGRQFRANATRSTVEQWQLFDGTQGLNPLTDDPVVLTDDPNVITDGTVVTYRFHVRPTEWTANPDEVVGQVLTTVNVRTATAVQKIWEYGGTLVLTPSQVLDIKVTSSDPFKSAVTPVAATDYTVSVGSLASVSLLSTSGQTITLRLTAGGGGATVLGVTSNGIQVRAVSLPITSENPVASTVDTALASARYAPEDYTINLWPEITWNQALDLVNDFARRYQAPRDQMVVVVANLDISHMQMLLHVRISDRIRIRHTHGIIDAPFYIESMHHDLSSGGGLHLLTLLCERVTDDVPAVFGTARYGFDAFSS